MLDQNELNKYFSKSQQQDMIELDITCQNTPRGRIRRARPRKVNPDHIPRPVNSFMSYRTEKQSIIKKMLPTANHRDISKMVAKWWYNIGPAEKSIYVDLAKKAKQLHTEKFPDYTFRPKCKSRVPKVTKPLQEEEEEENSTTTVTDQSPDTCARIRPYMSKIKSKQVTIPSITDKIFNFHNSSSTSSSSTIHSSAASSNNSSSVNHPNYDASTSLYHAPSNSMYDDEILFEDRANENNNNFSFNFWNNTFSSFTRDQVLANVYPAIHSVAQTTYPSYYEYPTLSYYPSPLPSSVLSHEPIQAIDPTALSSPFLPPITTSSSLDVISVLAILPPPPPPPYTDILYNSGLINSEAPLFASGAGFNYEITPYSQAMSTPMLDYSNSPASLYNNVHSTTAVVSAPHIIHPLATYTQQREDDQSPEVPVAFNISTNDFFDAHQQDIFSMFQQQQEDCLSNGTSTPGGGSGGLISLIQW